MAKVLVVTDYGGWLHIVPVNNKNWHLERNKVIKDKQYRLKEMEEEEADKFYADNNGADPSFVSPKKANAMIASKDDEIKALKEQLAQLTTGKKSGHVIKESPLEANGDAGPAVKTNQLKGSIINQ